MNEIVALGKEAPVNFNQLVRWVNNKEEHAQKIQDIVTDYFMAQRVKAPDSREGEPWAAYITQLALLHQIQVAAMKAKQTTDLANVEAAAVAGQGRSEQRTSARGRRPRALTADRYSLHVQRPARCSAGRRPLTLDV